MAMELLVRLVSKKSKKMKLVGQCCTKLLNLVNYGNLDIELQKKYIGSIGFTQKYPDPVGKINFLKILGSIEMVLQKFFLIWIEAINMHPMSLELSHSVFGSGIIPKKLIFAYIH